MTASGNLGGWQNAKLLLGRQEEEDIDEIVKKDARKKCHQDINAFVDCSKDKLFSVVKACKPQYDAMNSCLKN